METNIKVKATLAQMDMFAELCCVKSYEWDKWLNDGKRRNLYRVTLRHGEDDGIKEGCTYTVETLLKKCWRDVETNLFGNIRRRLSEIMDVFSFVREDDKTRRIAMLNKVLQEYGLDIKERIINH